MKYVVYRFLFFKTRGRYTVDPNIVYVKIPVLCVGLETGFFFRCFRVAAPTTDTSTPPPHTAQGVSARSRRIAT